MDIIKTVDGISTSKVEVLDILKYPNERLLQKSDLVIPGTNVEKEWLDKLIDCMLKTLHDYRAVGLAAIQVGFPLQVLVVQDGRTTPMVLINPTIKDTKGTCMMKEGCLSLPNLFVNVARPELITVEWMDRDFRPRLMDAEGLLARGIQHEIDHLNGLTVFDRLHPIKRVEAVKKWNRISKKLPGILV